MLGTGECSSSASESTMPSCTSSSCTVGTYWRQIGSSGAWIKSTIAGEIRNSKFSAACCSFAISGKCSGPNRAASCSSAATLPGYYAPGDDLVSYLKDLADGDLAGTTS